MSDSKPSPFRPRHVVLRNGGSDPAERDLPEVFAASDFLQLRPSLDPQGRTVPLPGAEDLQHIESLFETVFLALNEVADHFDRIDARHESFLTELLAQEVFDVKARITRSFVRRLRDTKRRDRSGAAITARSAAGSRYRPAALRRPETGRGSARHGPQRRFRTG